MIITINNIPLDNWYIKETKLPQKIKKLKIKETRNNIIKPKFNKLDFCTKILFAAAVTPAPFDFSGLQIIIKLFQEFAYYIGMGYATWGAIEYAMDNPAGADKAKRAVVGFIGIYVIPVIFTSIKNALG